MTAAHENFAQWCTDELARVEHALGQWIAEDAPAGLGAPMRYAVLDGGKRLRPLLVLAAAQAAGTLDVPHAEASLRAGCAVELIHAYSLVHDDMPCMDNDVLRRGKPTVHIQFGQAQALLAGDALQALAFELLVPEGRHIPDAIQAKLCRQLALAAGYSGMAGGQAIDLASVGKRLSQPELQQMHKLKTGALLQASVEMGATCASISGKALDALKVYGAALGLAFQVIDDVLDVVADSATLGKTAGKDADNDKPTYVSLMGLDAAKAYAHELLAEAQQALAGSGLPQTRALAALADMVVRRTH
ncbi:MAG: polyprenyl synthetase family protein [Comamonas sp.]